MHTSPPKAPLAFRVGIVGHRPKRLALAHADLSVLAAVMKDVLQQIKQAVDTFPDKHPGIYDAAAPSIRAISPLAEGSDRIFARAAVDLGFELCCPFPFQQTEYEEDFTPGQAEEPDSLANFHALLADARKRTVVTVFQLDGKPNDRPAAYANGGRVVMNQSDVLVVVWDGVALGKHGGTETTLASAKEKGVPIVLIGAQAPHTIEILAKKPTLAELVDDLLALPLAESEDGREALLRFYDERTPIFKPKFVWTLFRAAFGFRWWWTKKQEVPRPADDIKIDSPAALRPYEYWIDTLASHFANAYRAAFLVAYFLASTAVALAVAPIALGWLVVGAHERETLAALLEGAAIVVILFLWVWGRRRHWHERWLDYRLGAELIRHLKLASPLGSERPFPQLAAHLAKYGQPGATWTAWYVRAIERKLGLPAETVDADYLIGRARALRALMAEQLRYHEVTCGVCHRIERRLHVTGITFLLLTLAAATIHVLGEFGWLPHLIDAGVLISMGAVFPAIGASLAGINNQGEFKRIAKRSEAMAGHLNELQDHARKLAPDDGSIPAELSWESVAELTTRASHQMLSEVLDWRVVFLDRPLNPPS